MPKPQAQRSSARVKAQSAPQSAKKKGNNEAQDVANFLLSLKHGRSVSPDPNDPEPQKSKKKAVATGAKKKKAAPKKKKAPHKKAAAKKQQAKKEEQAKPDEPVARAEPEQPVDTVKAVPQQPTSASKAPAAPIVQTAGPLPPVPPVQPISSNVSANSMDFNMEELLDGSKLVLNKDSGLVPDALFVAMGQMKMCRLTQADRVGCYKARDIGFVGMCCKHCGGQPGFGRYYPNSVRSLAQTTTSQTILKHIGSKCRFCPPDVRNAVLELQRIQAVQEGMAVGRPRYGSRKIFFQRVWARLHGGVVKEDEQDCSLSKHSVDTASLEDEVIAEPVAEEGEDDSASGPKRKNRFGALPIMSKSNKRMKISEVVYQNVASV